MKSKDIALGGILTGLTVLILYSTSLLPISTISILTIASCIIPICIMRSSIKTAAFVYVASSILSFFSCQMNIVVMYSLFFGVYGIVKYLVEKKRNMLIELVIKFLFFNIVVIIGMYIMISILGESITTLPLWALWLASQPAFLLYDYALSMIITWYLEKIHKHI